ncbi:AAA family ATPase [Rhodobacteraceae bacterium 2376]|uniref:AAA family ATPase n=1 Tax=Rhabdonatronobacter sediminivivens TaxID=2743469 RepID=A0A7Z0KYY2_9RHOB|nr:AAA family ATPase [Rhabdonatronobacter sediminivivens]NYS26107.1 AAA family ATPase [Rhabdonatronobacter sediminivivens]
MRHESHFEIDQHTPVSAAPDGAADSRAGQFTLTRFRVSNFRSVSDSGWLTLDRVTALIGVNESGKTNLLLPLWKLNPASGGALEPIADYPKALFATLRAAPDQFQFITAEFDTGQHAATLARLAGIPEAQARRVSVARLYSGAYQIAFPDFARDDDAALTRAFAALRQALAALDDSADPLQPQALALVEGLLAELQGQDRVTANDLRLARNAVSALIPRDPPAVSAVIAQLRRLQSELGTQMAAMLTPDPASHEELRRAVIALLPRFVYYSNYGNLDSEIYLPHVVENLHRRDLGARESAKARTLKVVFDFVGLQAQEILQLGRDFRDIRDEAEARMIAEQGRTGVLRSLWMRARGQQHQPDPALLAQIAQAKRTRSILLQSAGTKLTERFAEWWKQGDYRFRFEADGNHFRIWVADARRPQEVELEHRSTGLQWFLSFFLVFLHEAKGAHDNCVLLLDEPGHSLHPLAQRDLSVFFDGLGARNQIIYTTHSPFLVDADRLARARKVFIDRDGSTRATDDLLLAEGSDTRHGAGFAVRAALNLAVAEASMHGTRPVLVQGQVEQAYLAMMKTQCIAAGAFAPRHDLVFAPACNARIMHVMARMLSEEDQGPPPVLVDDGARGRGVKAGLGDSAAVLDLEQITGLEGATIEDLMPAEDLARQLDRVERRPERLFADCLDPQRPFVAQALAWAEAEGITLADDWRLALATRMRKHVLGDGQGAALHGVLPRWTALLRALSGA